jgi:AcrR family transcriptional regulator
MNGMVDDHPWSRAMPQQRRAQATRSAIMLAAAEEFDRVGYAATTLSAILRRGDITKGAFYFHFSSKQALADALVRLQAYRWSRLRQSWMRRGLDPLSTAIGMVDEATRLLESDVLTRSGTRLACRRGAASAAERDGQPDWEALLADLLTRSAERGSLRPEVDPAAVACVVYAGLVGVRALGPDSPAESGMSARVAEIWRVVLEGIASPDWLRNSRVQPMIPPGRS